MAKPYTDLGYRFCAKIWIIFRESYMNLGQFRPILEIWFIGHLSNEQLYNNTLLVVADLQAIQVELDSTEAKEKIPRKGNTRRIKKDNYYCI